MNLTQKASEIRKICVKMAHDAPSSHIACALSCVDILTALFFDVMKPADRFILSKGHAAISYYAALAEAEIFSKDLLETYSKNGSILPEHPPSHGAPGIEVATGSLGHGLSISVGAALARKIKGIKGHEFVLLGDGECNEGSVWEAAMVAANLLLDNVVVIIDNNGMQAAGFKDSFSLYDKWRSFGWWVCELDGHNISEISDAIKKQINKPRPKVLIANTVKGKGVSFMEKDLLWHYRAPNDEELEKALEEL